MLIEGARGCIDKVRNDKCERMDVANDCERRGCIDMVCIRVSLYDGIRVGRVRSGYDLQQFIITMTLFYSQMNTCGFVSCHRSKLKSFVLLDIILTLSKLIILCFRQSRNVL